MLRKLATLCAALITVSALKITAFADTYAYVKISGVVDYDAAYEALELTNRERANAGLEPLVMSETLLNVATQRAFESSLLFDHTRPDGSDLTTLQDTSTWYGENLFAGSSKPSDAISSLMNSSGHRANILHSGYHSVGIACVGGTYVQQFSGNYAYPASKPANSYETRSIKVKTSNLRIAPSFYYGSKNKLKTGDTEELHAPVLYAGGFRAACVDDSNYSVSVSDASKVCVNGMTITALSAGDVAVTFTLKGTSLSATVNFTIEDRTRDIAGIDFNYEFSQSSIFVYDGTAHTPDISVYDNGTKLINGIDYTVEYHDNISRGLASAEVYGKGKYSGHVSMIFEITRRSIAGIELNKTEYTYNGKEHCPVLTEGKAGTDYNIRYQDNVSAGTALAIIEAYTDNYIGRAEIPFTIKPASISGMTAKLSETEYTFSGKECKPSVTIGGLTEGRDFTISYSDNKSAGTASVKITGIGNYAGEIEKKFTTLPAVITTPAPETSTMPAPETSSKPSPETSSKPSPETSTKPAPETSTKPAPETSSKPSSETSSKPSPETSSMPSPETSTKPAPETSSKPSTETSTKPAPETSSKPSPETSTKPAPETSSKSAPETSSKSAPETSSKSAPETSSKSAPETSSKPSSTTNNSFEPIAGTTPVPTVNNATIKKTVSTALRPAKAVISKITLKKGKLTLKWKADKNVSGYTVAYKKAGSSGYSCINVKGTSSGKTISGLKKGTYTVKIRSYKIDGKGKKYYSEWSSAKKVTIK